MRLALIGSALLIAGCATSTTTYLPDGSRGHSIVCSGAALSWAQCDEKAGALCKAAGYDIISKSSDAQSSISGTQFGLFGSTSQSRSMLIKCKGEEPAEAPNKKPARKPGNPAMN